MKMRLIRISGNVRELQLNNGRRILISYSTPVAILYKNGKFACSDKYWSSTTNRQIANWHNTLTVTNLEDSYWRNTIPQESLNRMLIGTILEKGIGQWKQFYSQTYLIKDFNQSVGK